MVHFSRIKTSSSGILSQQRLRASDSLLDGPDRWAMQMIWEGYLFYRGAEVLESFHCRQN
jgi:hypothetical protein